MQVTKISYQPNFKAKFVQNEAITNIIKKEIKNGNGDRLELALKELNNHHKNVALLYSKDGTVTNLFNNRSIRINNMDTYNIESLSNINTLAYRQLFINKEALTPDIITKKMNRISRQYLVKSVPDYEMGRKLDEYYG
ncbi:MAG: hypothetical protein E7Z87_03395 [Cyanobacteria bacterium SIG26]|nr:hypothetical protein [Cyanobacteria bacterium SIG26]